MKMRHLALVATVLIAADVFGETDELHGVWTTGPVLSQLGMVVTEKDFRTNGVVSSRVQFLQMTNVPPMVVTGTYSAVDGTLTTVVRGGTNATPYTIEGDTLIMIEKRNKETRLTRKKEGPEPAGGAYVSLVTLAMKTKRDER